MPLNASDEADYNAEYGAGGEKSIEVMAGSENKSSPRGGGCVGATKEI